MIPAPLADRTLRWRRRLPRVVLSLAVALPLLALVVLETALDTSACTEAQPCRFPLDTLAYQAVPVAEVLAMSGVLMALVLPRATVWVAAASAALLAGPASVDSSVPGLWRWALLWFLGLGALDLAGRWQQLVESHTWGAPILPYPDADPAVTDRMPRDEDTRALALVVATVGVVAAGVLLAWHLHETARVRDVELHATRATGTVTHVGVDGSPVTVVVGGRTVQLETSGAYAVGQSVPVLVDVADPGHVELVAEPEDPSWRIGVAALVLAVALALAGRLASRGRRRSRLMRQGGPAVRLRVGVERGDVVLTTLDDERFARPLAVVGADLVPSAILLPVSMTEQRARAFPEDEWELEHDDAAYEPPDVSTLSDAELARWADEQVEAFEGLEDDDWAPPPSVPPTAEGGTTATVVGLRQDGDPVLLLLDDGESLVSGAGVRDPWGWRRLRERVLHRRPSDPRRRAPGPSREQEPRHDEGEVRAWRSGPSHRVATTAAGLVAPVARPLAYVLALAVYPVARWLLEDGVGWGELVRLLFAGAALAEALVFLAGMNRPALTPRPDGLLHSGRWLDELIPARRVVAVTPGRSSVVLKLVEPDDALALPPQAVVRFAEHLRAETTPEQAGRAIEEMLRSTTPTAGRGWRRPSLALVPGVLGALALLAAWATAHFGS